MFLCYASSCFFMVLEGIKADFMGGKMTGQRKDTGMGVSSVADFAAAGGMGGNTGLQGLRGNYW
jgi:hypothetical protein